VFDVKITRRGPRRQGKGPRQARKKDEEAGRPRQREEGGCRAPGAAATSGLSLPQTVGVPFRREARETELGRLVALLLDAVAVVHEPGLGLDGGGEGGELLERGVDASLEELAVVEDGLEAVLPVHVEDEVGIEARVAREEDPAVEDEAVAREGVFPAGGGIGDVLGPVDADLQGTFLDHRELPVGLEDPPRGHLLEEVLEDEGRTVLHLVVGGAAAEGHGPEDALELVRDDDPGPLVGGVAVEEHDLLEAADMVGVAVGHEVGADVGDGKAEAGQGFGGAAAAVHEDVHVALHHEYVVLEEFLGEGRSRAYEGYLEVAPVAECEGGAVSAFFCVIRHDWYYFHYPTVYPRWLWLSKIKLPRGRGKATVLSKYVIYSSRETFFVFDMPIIRMVE